VVLEAHMALNTRPNQEQVVLRYSLARNLEKPFV